MVGDFRRKNVPVPFIPQLADASRDRLQLRKRTIPDLQTGGEGEDQGGPPGEAALQAQDAGGGGGGMEKSLAVYQGSQNRVIQALVRPNTRRRKPGVDAEVFRMSRAVGSG